MFLNMMEIIIHNLFCFVTNFLLIQRFVTPSLALVRPCSLYFDVSLSHMSLSVSVTHMTRKAGIYIQTHVWVD